MISTSFAGVDSVASLCSGCVGGGSALPDRKNPLLERNCPRASWTNRGIKTRSPRRHQRPKKSSQPQKLWGKTLLLNLMRIEAGREKNEVGLEPVESTHYPRRRSVETSGVDLSTRPIMSRKTAIGMVKARGGGR